MYFYEALFLAVFFLLQDMTDVFDPASFYAERQFGCEAT